MSRFVVSCGGTGGHLAPGIALAEELVARGHRVVLLISEKKVDAQLSAKYPHLHFERLPGAPFSWRPAAALRFTLQQARGWGVARRLVRSVRPAAIIGFGGFTSAAVLLVARWQGVPIVLHEANRVPGRAIRTMARLAQRIYLPPGIMSPPAWAERVRFAGVPVRREMQVEPRAAARAAWGLTPDLPLVAVLGGSQGAQALNTWALGARPELAAAGVQLLCVTGTARGAEQIEHAANGPEQATPKALFIPFCDRMATLLSAADVVVSRAGAGTIAELIRCRTPAVLVPYPFAADNHQAANAAWFAAQGGGMVIAQTEISRVTAAVLAMLQDTTGQQGRRTALANLDGGNPGGQMADELERIARESGTLSFSAGRPATV